MPEPEADSSSVSNEYVIIAEFLRVHQAFLWVIGASSVLLFVGVLVAIPILVIRIPADYFIRGRRISSVFKYFLDSGSSPE